MNQKENNKGLFHIVDMTIIIETGSMLKLYVDALHATRSNSNRWAQGQDVNKELEVILED